MNVAVLTHCVARNYGANLQALSTALHLKENGFNPVFLKWDAYIHEIKCKEQIDLHESFLKKYGFTVTNSCIDDEDFLREIENYQIKNIIVGSDCVLTMGGSSWLPYTIKNGRIVKKEVLKDYIFPNPFWLEYLYDRKDIRKFLLSASSGTSNIKNISLETRMYMKRLLQKFDYISVRDLYTQRTLKNVLDLENEVILSPDPVFGFNDDLSIFPDEETIKDKYNLPRKYAVVSFYENNLPSVEWFEKLRYELREFDIDLVYIPMPQGGVPSKEIRTIELPIDPMDWYSIIKYSNGYIGNNMHPIIVSIHNVVPFFSIDIHGKNYLKGKIQLTRNSKETQLLTHLNLMKYHTSQMLYKVYPIKRIVENMVDFNFEQCSRASRAMKEKFNETMSTIINNFKY